jgi:hypothetical protein
LLESFEQFNEAFMGTGALIDAATDAYENVKFLVETGQQFSESVKVKHRVVSKKSFNGVYVNA